MKQQTLGTMIAALRKNNGLTQLELANKMQVTDKAVSKWERDISCPDIHSLPKLAEALGVSVDALMQCKGNENNNTQASVNSIVSLIFKAIPLAMGVAVTVLSILGEIDANTAFPLLGIGLACAGISLLNHTSENK